MASKEDRKAEIRAQAESDLEAFIRLVHPQRVLGSVHVDLIRWWTRSDQKTHQLTLLPRDHQKSALIAYRVVWEITRNPCLRVLYVSSTSTLAGKQIKFIKDILLSPIYKYYWPEMVNADVNSREKWTESEFSVDHPLRAKEAIRDATVFTAGLTTSITGLHCDVAVLDDIVVNENAYTQDGRDRVETQYSLLASIEGTDSREWVVGTRYHPKDLYGTLADREVDKYTNNELSSTEPLYEVFERRVESIGNGTGEFLWPRQTRYDGKVFGFDADILAKKRAQYLDRTQFRAQYYNDPNDAESAAIQRDVFQYYDQKHLTRSDGRWYLKGYRLNVFASVDFAFSLNKRSDYSCICVIGCDAGRNYYILDIDRFKTDKISDYFDHILKLHQKWDFRKLRAEVTMAQQVIVKDLKDNYIRAHNLSLAIEDHKPNRYKGSKEERISAVLQPRYTNRQIWHYYGGNCQVLEEELVLQNPAHDDVKDALAACIEFAVPPSSFSGGNAQQKQFMHDITNSRFGGIYVSGR